MRTVFRQRLFDRRRVRRAMGVNGEAIHDCGSPMWLKTYHTMRRPRPPSAARGKCLTISAPAMLADQERTLMEATTIALLVLIPLLVWRLYCRLKNLIGGRRRSEAGRHWAALIVFSALLAAAALGAAPDPLALSCLGAGALAGAWLGRLEMRLTRFENTGKGLFFTPSRHLGIMLTMLFAARLLYRGLELYIDSRSPAPAPLQDFMHSPLTLLSLGLWAAYFAACGVGLLLWRRSQRPLDALN